MNETGTHINSGMIPSGIGKVGPKAFPRVAMDLATTVERIQQNFVICDPSLPDCPIVFASDAFLDLTEFPREEVLGRNCRFLQVSCYFELLLCYFGRCASIA
jgi:PAS domain-containing protein